MNECTVILPITHLYLGVADILASMKSNTYSIEELFMKVVARYPELNNESFESRDDEFLWDEAYMRVYGFIDSFIFTYQVMYDYLRVTYVTQDALCIRVIGVGV